MLGRWPWWQPLSLSAGGACHNICLTGRPAEPGCKHSAAKGGSLLPPGSLAALGARCPGSSVCLAALGRGARDPRGPCLPAPFQPRSPLLQRPQPSA